MRVNVYSQEITDEVSVIEQVSDTGLVYTGVRMMLHSSPFLHFSGTDDDRSAVTYWLPRSRERREALAKTLEVMAMRVRTARPETGMD